MNKVKVVVLVIGVFLGIGEFIVKMFYEVGYIVYGISCCVIKLFGNLF